MGSASVNLWEVTSMCYYLLSMKQNPPLWVDLQVKIGTVTETKEKKENLYLDHNGPKGA